MYTLCTFLLVGNHLTVMKILSVASFTCNERVIKNLLDQFSSPLNVRPKPQSAKCSKAVLEVDKIPYCT